MAKKIALVVPDINKVGGVEQVALNLQDVLARKGHAVDIVSLFSSRSDNCSVNLNLSRRKLKLFRLFHKSKKLNLLDNYDVIIGGNFFRYYSNPSLFSKTHNVEIQHMSYDESVELKGFRRVLSLLFRKYYYKKLDSLVVLTEREKKKFENDGLKNVFLIENGIEERDLKISKAEGPLISFGRLTYQKGFDILIPSFKLVVEKVPAIEWHIYAEGEMEPQIRESIKHHELEGHIKLKKFTSNVIGEMSNASILLFPSRYEGFPLTLLEAMSVGLPCIAFDCDSGPAEIIKNGEDGYVIPNFDANHFLKKTLLLLDNEKELVKFSESAYINIKRYSWQQISLKWERLLASF